MGNYYKPFRYSGKTNGFRRFAKRRSGKKIAFIGGAILVLLFTVMQFSPAGSGMKNALNSGKDSALTAFQTAFAWGRDKLGLPGDVSLTVPVSSGVVVEEFGVISDAEGNEAYHNGIDIQVPTGSEILAAADGEVTAVDQHDDSTYWVTISHKDDWSTVYGRLGESKVAVGDQVAKGDVLGTPANEILHFSVLEGDTEKDPVNYFETEDQM